MPSADPSAADGAVDETHAGVPDGPAPVPEPPVPSAPRAFPRAARLLDGRAYDAVFADNHRVADRYWTVLVHRVRDGAPPGRAARLGLAVAKKRARRAVDRNRIKRVARESFRHARAALEGHHVVVMNRDAAAGASPTELRRSLDALWSRALRRPATSGRPGRGDGRRAAGVGRPAGGATCRDGAGSGRTGGGR